jgi:Uma2 family endonuclease
MSTAEQPTRHEAARMTVEAFLALPGDGSGRIYELVHGEIRAQDAASDAHGSIQSRLNALLTLHLDKVRPGCRVVANPGIKPRLLAKWDYRIPELGVTCTPNRADVRETPDPILLVEVLSPSNEADTWSNVPLYATLPSVQEILLVDSSKVEAMLLLRRGADGHWPQEPHTIEPGGVIALASIGLEVTLAEVCRDTHLSAGPRE